MKARILLVTGIFVLVLLVAANLPAKSTLFTLVYDMFNQVSIKPQEAGSMNDFVIGAVSIDGSEIEDPNDRFTNAMEFVLGVRTYLESRWSSGDCSDDAHR